MKKINCPKCGNEILDTVRECPFCGFNEISSYLLQLEKQKADKYIDYTSFHNEIPINDSSQVNIPKCPTCGSTNVRKMGGVERGASIAAFGIFSKKINKTFKCGNCGCTW